MFKSLCLAAVCVFSHVNTIASCSNSNVNNNDNYDNYLPRVSEVNRAYDGTLTISGNYNFVDIFDIRDFDNQYDIYNYYFESISLVAGSPITPANYTRACPVSYDNGYYYLWEIKIEVIDGGDNDNFDDFYITFSYYDENEDLGNFYFLIYSSHPSLSYYSSGSDPAYNVFFNVISPIYVHGLDADLWNRIFTTASNDYVINYTGYFTYTGGNLLSSGYFAILGTTTYANRISFMYNFYSISGYATDSVTWLIYDVLDNKYTSADFLIYSRSSNYVYFSNVKMLRTTYNSLNGSIGTFGYVNPSQPTDFEDLLFSIADSNIYMLSSLLNFELFGMNLYIALAGLITLLVVIFIIRKIW